MSDIETTLDRARRAIKDAKDEFAAAPPTKTDDALAQTIEATEHLYDVLAALVGALHREDALNVNLYRVRTEAGAPSPSAGGKTDG